MSSVLYWREQNSHLRKGRSLSSFLSRLQEMPTKPITVNNTETHFRGFLRITAASNQRKQAKQTNVVGIFLAHLETSQPPVLENRPEVPGAVKFMCQEGTMKTACLRHMGKKLLVALTMEGKFAGEGLQNLDEETNVDRCRDRNAVTRN
jgi:hypothetical protein